MAGLSKKGICEVIPNKYYSLQNKLEEMYDIIKNE